jgi:triacylglycerol lipase
MQQREHVLLVHGLAESSAWMGPLALALRLRGFTAFAMDYPSTTDRIENLTENYLLPEILKYAQASTLHIVTHSLGSVMVRYYLQTRRIPNLGRIVMLAPGNAGSRMLTYLNRLPLYATIMGPASLQSADDENCFSCMLPPKLDADFGVIAGCVPLDPLAWLVMREPNDGRVTVASTMLGGMRDHIVLPASHDSLLFDPVAMAQTCEFLQRGEFLHAPRLAYAKNSAASKVFRQASGR